MCVTEHGIAQQRGINMGVRFRQGLPIGEDIGQQRMGRRMAGMIAQQFRQ